MRVTLEPELRRAVISAAARVGQPVSARLAEAAATKLRAEALAEFLGKSP